jgi:pimeloyl-ACP methyl ester carboxylesterase
MVKKTLLSLAIAASTAGLTACNISSTADNNIVDNNPVVAGSEGSTPSVVAPIFSAGNAELPLANDFLFAINSQLADGQPGKDGTANTADTSPPVTTALNKLDGFSTTAAHYINFNAALNGDSVIAGQTVFLIKLKNGEDNAAIDPVDLASIVANGGASPVDSEQLIDGQGQPLYEANYVTLDEGATHAIQILPKTPLDPKTKYIIALTDSIKDTAGNSVGRSAEYDLLSGDLELASSALLPARDAVQAWEAIAGGFLEAATAEAVKQENVVLSYAFTTTGTTDVLHAMAAPGTFLTSQITSIDAAEAAITASVYGATYTATYNATYNANIAGAVDPENPTAEEIAAAEATADATAVATANATVEGTLDTIAGQVATSINAAQPGALPTTDGATVRPALKATPSLQPFYYQGLITAIADGSGAGVDYIVDKPQSRTYTPIISAPATPVAVPYDTLLTAQITAKVQAQLPEIAHAEAAISGSVIAGGGDQAAADATLLAIAQGVATAINTEAGTTVVPVDATSRDVLLASEQLSPNYYTGLVTTIVDGQVDDLSSEGAIYQGGLTIPSYLPASEAGVEDAALGYWQGSNNAALALGLPAAPTDVNGEINVTYRFPYANKLGDSTIPVMVTMPKADCDPGTGAGKPAEGWPVVIYQHGITVDRTAGILVGNTLADNCIAMVAIDHAMHGVAPLDNDGEANGVRLFNVEQVAAADVETNSPFAAARAGIIQAFGAENVPELAAMAERHNNVGKAVAGGPNVAMVYQGALDGEGNPVAADSVGASGDLYINLQNFARTRDGIRQTVMDMLNLGASIGDMDVNADGTADDLDPSKIYFIGHSLGGIVGTTFLSVNNDPQVRAYNSNLPSIQAVALGNPGGGFVKLLENSPQIGAKVLAGLAVAGVPQGSSVMEQFTGVFQAMVDSADPINFAAGTQDIPTIVYTDVGGLAAAEGEDDDNALSDQVVPNNALSPVVATAKSFLSGTDPLVAEMGITDIVDQTTAVAGGAINADPQYYFPNATNDSVVRANVRFTKGTHSTFSSADPKDVFAETYQQIITYFDPYGLTKLGGLPGDQQGFVVENTSILEAGAAE